MLFIDTNLTKIVNYQYLLSGPLRKHLWTRGCHCSRKGTKDNRETYGRGCMPIKYCLQKTHGRPDLAPGLYSDDPWSQTGL